MKTIESKRFVLLSISLTLAVAVVNGVIAQANQFVSSKQVVRDTAEPADKNSYRPGISNLHIVPLFGELPRSTFQKKEDERFFQNCDKLFPNRQEASAFFAERAWDYLKEGELDTAVYRFNLAYLLNPNSAEAYWGLGVISFHRNDLPEAIRLLGKGLVVEPKNAPLMVDLATLHLNYFKQKNDTLDITKAEHLLNQSIAIEPNNANAYLKLSIAEFYQQHYDEAWADLHKCRQLDLSSLDLTFLAELKSKKEDPQGVFK
ncbi:MAG: tetratricopeptide repeat protein [Spirosomataceae bacterium]